MKIEVSDSDIVKINKYSNEFLLYDDCIFLYNSQKYKTIKGRGLLSYKKEKTYLVDIQFIGIKNKIEGKPYFFVSDEWIKHLLIGTNGRIPRLNYAKELFNEYEIMFKNLNKTKKIIKQLKKDKKKK